MGVAGSGKTTVGAHLARKLGWKFADADQFHSEENKRKMAAGTPLTDSDREPWLQAMREAIKQWQAEDDRHVLACSALKSSYRHELKCDDPGVAFVFLDIDQTLALQRLEQRQNHFMKPNMIASQFATLEVPDAGEAITIAASQSDVEQIVSEIVRQLSARQGRL